MVSVHPANTNAYVVTSLAAAAAMGAARVDPNLIQPWAIASIGYGAYGGPGGVQVVNFGSSTTTGYDYQGNPLPAGTWTETFSSEFQPTGLTENLVPDFAFSDLNASCGETGYFIVGASGSLAGFTPGCGTPFTVFTASDNAAYMAVTADQKQIYATDFHNGKIDVFDSKFKQVVLTATQFVDPNLPANYSPYGILAVVPRDETAATIYVTYAQRDPQSPDAPAVGMGLGLVDVFDMSGTFRKRLVQPGGVLNLPWGMAGPARLFGSLSNALLVANVGDGTISGYDLTSGQLLGTLATASGQFAMPGLRGITFGIATATVDLTSTLYFTVAPSGGKYGMLGSIGVPRP